MARQVVSVFVNLRLKYIGFVIGVAQASKFLAPPTAAALQHFLAVEGARLRR